MSTLPIRVLLVEDNPGDARLIRETLLEANHGGFALTHVTRMADALAQLSPAAFDIVLLDLSLPDSHGIDTCQQLLNEEADVPVIVLTGMDDESLSVTAVQEGAQDYLVKGQVTAQLLARAIRYAIERHRLQATLRSLSLTDPLTGLYNRRGFFTISEQQMRLMSRMQLAFTLFYTDLDGLKTINDSMGHKMGDLAITAAAEALTETFRASDIIGRLGGDEFVVLAFGIGEQDVVEVLDRLEQKLADRQTRLPYALPLSMSVGAAVFNPASPLSLNELLAHADEVMYEQKRTRHAARGVR